MKLSSKKIVVIILLLLGCAPQAKAFLTQKHMLIAGAGAATIIVGYKGYLLLAEYLNNKIVDTTVDALVIGLMSHSKLKTFPASAQEKILRKKAYLVAVRTRIISALEGVVADAYNGLSAAHKEVIKKETGLTKAAFAVVDFFRKDNPYQKEYESPSTIDGIIESNILSAMTLATKPANECTPKELAQQKKGKEFAHKIATKLEQKVDSILLKGLLQSAFAFNMLLNVFGVSR